MVEGNDLDYVVGVGFHNFRIKVERFLEFQHIKYVSKDFRRSTSARLLLREDGCCARGAR